MIDNALRKRPSDIVVAVSGNPNVGKSTLFNALTGLRQHTGNWTGKTVDTARGECIHNGRKIVLVDLPGSYSLCSHSDEERVAESFILFGGADVNLVVVDALSLKRNMNLLLQITEICPRIVLCVNLIDEADKRGISIDTTLLSERLNIPVIPIIARNKTGLDKALDAIIDVSLQSEKEVTSPRYNPETEQKIEEIAKNLPDKTIGKRFIALKLLQNDTVFFDNYKNKYGTDISLYKPNETVSPEIIVDGIRNTIESVLNGCIKKRTTNQIITDVSIDRIITSKCLGIPLMLILLMGILWITISGANYPSALLSNLFSNFEGHFYNFLLFLHLPSSLCNLLVFGVYRVVTFIVSVMLPPMAIFFPLFTLLEDLGVLPRIAFNLDKCFQKCRTCGKQALTMCMGLGCNAVGVVGCRIIDSPREKLIAILTNSLMPCNGRFPTIITLITLFFIGVGAFSTLGAAAILCVFLVICIFATLLISKLLSATVLKGIPSSFALELPPFRKPQIIKVIIRSIFDRTIYVLARAVTAAIPAGIIIWLLSNIQIHDSSLLLHISSFLDPFARFLGLDGVILLAFILGLPANEIVLPIIIMAYSGGSVLTDISNLTALRELLINNGWSVLTAANVILFSLFHWPCATTLLTIKKETGSIKWTVISAILPTAFGILICLITTLIFK